MYRTKVRRDELRDLVENLKMLIEEMEDLDIKEIETESNTYFCKGNDYISFSGIGFLPIREDYYEVLSEEENEEEE